MTDTQESIVAEQWPEGMVASLQSLYGEVPVENTAFELLHHIEQPYSGSSNIKEFIDSYLSGAAASKGLKRHQAIEQLLGRLGQHAETLAFENPSNLQEIDRRVNMWLGLLNGFTLGRTNASRRALGVVIKAERSWTRAYQSVKVGQALTSLFYT